LDICVEEINLSKLLKEKLLTIASQVAANGYIISVSFLADSGANSPIFIDSDLAIEIAKRFNLYTLRLLTSCEIKGFDGESKLSIIYAIVML
jgi:hypothetical protein